jgi:nucleoside-diphosphate-sugar epimerase
MERSTTLIFGCGYLGHRAACAWQSKGNRVCVVTRSAERARGFADEGFEPVVADIMRPESLVNLPVAETVLFAVARGRDQTYSMRELYADGLKHVLDALPANTGRVIYISSTGVYGDTGGEWVDEDTPCEPEREGGHACLAAEQTLWAHPLAARGIVLRLAGIYGPGRVPRREDLVAGKPIAGTGNGFLNLIHVDDAARIVLAAATNARSPRTYLVSDGHPAPRHEYYAELARLMEVPPPRFDPASETASERQRGGADKRVRNTRMLAELGVEIEYPDFRHGLAAILAG